MSIHVRSSCSFLQGKVGDTFCPYYVRIQILQFSRNISWYSKPPSRNVGDVKWGSFLWINNVARLWNSWSEVISMVMTMSCFVKVFGILKPVVLPFSFVTFAWPWFNYTSTSSVYFLYESGLSTCLVSFRIAIVQGFILFAFPKLVQSKYKTVTSISNFLASLVASITVLDSWNAKLINWSVWLSR